MTNTFKVESIIYKALNVAEVTNVISGGVYKTRPINSTKEDVIIKSLPINAEQIQEGVVNVNIYVPNLVLQFNGMQDKAHANSERLDVLTDLVMAKLDLKYYADHWFTVQQQSVFEEGNEHYSNIRVEFYSENFKN